MSDGAIVVCAACGSTTRQRFPRTVDGRPVCPRARCREWLTHRRGPSALDGAARVAAVVVASAAVSGLVALWRLCL